MRVVAVLKNEQQVDSLTYESSITKEDGKKKRNTYSLPYMVNLRKLYFNISPSIVPSAAPSNINAITRSKTSLSLHWEVLNT